MIYYLVIFPKNFWPRHIVFERYICAKNVVDSLKLHGVKSKIFSTPIILEKDEYIPFEKELIKLKASREC